MSRGLIALVLLIAYIGVGIRFGLRNREDRAEITGRYYQRHAGVVSGQVFAHHTQVVAGRVPVVVA